MKTGFYRMEFEAWDAGTNQLTLEEEAAYLRFCHQMYRTRDDVPNHLPSLARLWRCHQNKARKVLTSLLFSGKIEVTHSGHLTNTRTRQELDTLETLRTHRSHTAKTHPRQSREKSDNPLKNNDGDEANASSRAVREDNIRGDKTREEEKERNAPASDASFDPVFDGSVPDDPVDGGLDSGSTKVDKAPLVGRMFEEWWSWYPNKVGKSDARKKFDIALRKVPYATLVDGLERYVNKQDDRPWCNPSTWLNQERWSDEPAQVAKRRVLSS